MHRRLAQVMQQLIGKSHSLAKYSAVDLTQANLFSESWRHWQAMCTGPALDPP